MALLAIMRVSCIAVLLSLAPNTVAVPLQERQTSVPQYVLDYAPVVWMQSKEKNQPGPIADQLLHTTPQLNFQAVTGGPNPLTLDNLDQLNNLPNASAVYLTSNDDITAVPMPLWLDGYLPDATGLSADADGANNAIIVVDKGNGIIDAFYMYFYPYNLGDIVFGLEIGDHVGDWEHNAIRFLNGVPQSVWYSQHASGEAFTYAAVEKHGLRPVSYSAVGSHANYAITGTHSHAIPGLNLPFPFIVNDFCDQGTLWDPILSTWTYSYDIATNTFAPYVSGTPTAWLNWVGSWGDQEYPSSNPKQHKFLGIELTAKFVGGPTGPRDKQLARSDICPSGIPGGCIVRDILVAK